MGAAWHDRVVGVSNPYPGAGSLGGACISANKGMSGNYFLATIQSLLWSATITHCPVTLPVGIKMFFRAVVIKQSKNVLSSSVYGDPKNGLSQTLVVWCNEKRRECD